jgi:hypothetical protein
MEASGKDVIEIYPLEAPSLVSTPLCEQQEGKEMKRLISSCIAVSAIALIAPNFANAAAIAMKKTRTATIPSAIAIAYLRADDEPGTRRPPPPWSPGWPRPA